MHTHKLHRPRSSNNKQAFIAHPGDIDAAIKAYEPGGLQRARDLYLRSKEVSKPLVYSAEEDDRRDEL